jgi:hypothetical protein
MVDVEVPKQYIVGKSIENSSRDIGKIFMTFKLKWLTKRLVSRGSGKTILGAVHIIDHDIHYTFQRAPKT